MRQEQILPSVNVAQSKIDALCVSALFKRTRKGEMLAPLAMLFLGWLEKDVVSTSLILSWILLVSAPNLASLFLSTHLLKHPPPDERMAHWHNWQFVVGSIRGLSWGIAVILFHVEGAGSFINDTSILIVLVAVSAVSIANIAPSMRTLAGYSSCILLIPAGYYFWLGDTLHVQFAVGLIMLWLVELEVGRDAYRQFADGVRREVINEEISKQLEIQNSQLDELNRQLSTLATHDKLTGLYNRHFIVEQMEMQYDLFMRYGTACSIVLVDIDYFKQVNDQYGHSVGDEVLVAFSRCIERQLRQGDIFARYGGEEFILVLPITDQKAAVHLANRMRSVIAGMPLAGHPAPLGVTASFGVAQLMNGETVDDWLNRADRALYQAKANGRNCVVP